MSNNRKTPQVTYTRTPQEGMMLVLELFFTTKIQKKKSFSRSACFIYACFLSQLAFRLATFHSTLQLTEP